MGLVQQRTWAELKELCGSGVLLRVSPIGGTSVVLCALAGKAVRLRCALILCFISSRCGRGRPVHGHRVMECTRLGFRGGILPFSPEGSAKRICRDMQHHS